jgi:hypothetical protein
VKLRSERSRPQRTRVCSAIVFDVIKVALAFSSH